MSLRLQQGYILINPSWAENVLCQWYPGHSWPAEHRDSASPHHHMAGPSCDSWLPPRIISPAWNNSQLQNTSSTEYLQTIVKWSHCQSKILKAIWGLCSWGFSGLNRANGIQPPHHNSHGLTQRNTSLGSWICCLAITKLICRSLQWPPLISRRLSVMWSIGTGNVGMRLPPWNTEPSYS